MVVMMMMMMMMLVMMMMMMVMMMTNLAGHEPAGRGLCGVQQGQAVHRGEAGEGREDPAGPTLGGAGDQDRQHEELDGEDQEQLSSSPRT